ncbi:tyrosine-type recombinase/integrase [Salinispora cortesiana]|uniref:tyrosine-type recombinase/integrase n=1 Tax=Salinispora cortesiana TaxID=1305843 RepID=UPI00046F92DA|nr:tyrosine-type recombinase/integrase [Salinispora cortesiana]
MPSTSKARKRSRGEIETLPSGSLRVRVYAGVDPVSKKRHYLVKTVPAGPKAAREAEKARTRLLNQVDEKRNPRTKATVNQLMDRYLEVLDVETTTRGTYEGYIRNHVRPLLGELAVGRLDGETLDSFYAVLRLCRAHCQGRKYIEHQTAGEHSCSDRCRPHACRPLADSSIRQIHGILSGACKRAVRWRWIGANPIDQAEPPSPARPDPRPPTPEQAASIATAAWRDLDWGMFVWLALLTGARRGELCALRWDRIDFATGVLTIRSSIAQSGAKTWEKDTKTHQQRRITLDDQTLALLRAYLRRYTERAATLGFTLPTDARVFSLSPDGSTWLKPDTVTQRYARMCARLGWDMNIHQLRHYSATELIAAGVDVRTVAGRLGHGGGGSTTLRVYSAWVSEADQRAAGTLTDRMPTLPAGLESDGALSAPLPDPITDDSAPYLRVVADLRAAIKCGALRQGGPLPTMVDLAARYEVAPSTAQRAVAILAADGDVVVSRGKRAFVAGS